MTTTAGASFTDDLLEEWELFGRAAGWSDATVTCRRSGLGTLARAASAPLESISALELARFLAGQRTTSTRATYYRHARSFFRWLKASGYRSDDPTEAMKAPRDPRGLPRPLSDAELERVLGECRSLDVYAMVTLGAYAGLRAHEIAKFRGEDIDVGAGSLRVLGKGGHEALVPLHARVVDLVSMFPDRGFWFPSGTAVGHVVADTVTHRFTRAFRALGIEGSTHRTRHWFGTNVMRASGGNLRVAQELLRHSSPVTTAIYTRVDGAERAAAVRAL